MDINALRTTDRTIRYGEMMSRREEKNMMTDCPNCSAVRSGARRLRHEIAGLKSAYEKLKAAHARLTEAHGALTKAARKELIRYNAGPGVKQERIALAKRLRETYSTAEIAVLMGYSRQRVHQWLKNDDYYHSKREVSKNLTLEASEKLKSLNSLSGTDSAL